MEKLGMELTGRRVMGGVEALYYAVDGDSFDSGPGSWRIDRGPKPEDGQS